MILPPHPLLDLVFATFIHLHLLSSHMSFFISVLPPLSICLLLYYCPTLHVLANFFSFQLSLLTSSNFLSSINLSLSFTLFLCPPPVTPFDSQLRSGETAAIVARELAEQTKGLLRPGDVPSTVRAMAQLVELLDVQLRNLTPGGKDSAARSLTKVLPHETLVLGGQCIASD